MRVSVQKWGNSLAVRIPKTVALESKIKNGSHVDMTLEDGRVVLTPVPKDNLEELLARISPDNIHKEIQSGPPRGREIW
ncbi:MAG: AbrB/MazE/SpoVT family DNA-binding domain-containing protein [Candidatus Solibacter usitatus]|nr:AbrB/MazE/SpoVT family DNA-binding domain-containing protein [Candidatus Solibacter usitatus]